MTASTLAPANSNLYLGRGMLYYDQFLAGTTTRTGELALGNCLKFEITMKDTMKEKYESMDHSSLLYQRAPIRRDSTIKIEGDEYSLENLAAVMMGNTAKLAQTGAAVTGESLTTAAVLGRYYPTKYRNISAVTLHDAASVKVLGTDYTVDAISGRIYILPTGSILAGDTLTVDYTYATQSLNMVQAGTSAKQDGYLRFVADPVSGPHYEVEVWHVNFTPSGAIGFIADDFGNWTLEGMVIADLVNHPTEPLYHVIDRGL